VCELENPQVVQRQGREIKYTKKPKVSFVRSFIYDSAIPAVDDDESAAPQEEEDQK
jgi:hypothetical protein